MAYCIPSISFLPPEAESPVEGSKTPILTTLSPEAAVLPAEEVDVPDAVDEDPQPPSAETQMAAAAASATNRLLFISSSSLCAGQNRHRTGVSALKIQVFLQRYHYYKHSARKSKHKFSQNRLRISPEF